MADKQFVKGFNVTKKESKYGTFYKCGFQGIFAKIIPLMIKGGAILLSLKAKRVSLMQ